MTPAAFDPTVIDPASINSPAVDPAAAAWTGQRHHHAHAQDVDAEK
jgi:hypothetical protein